jgi:hypothetical protein
MSEGASMGEHAQGTVAPPTSTRPVGVEDVAPHRRCVTCGFDVVGLPLTSGCPECQHPIAATVKRRMLRDSQNLRRLVQIGWWCWWTGIGATITTILVFIAQEVVLKARNTAFIDADDLDVVAIVATTLSEVSIGVVALAGYWMVGAGRLKTLTCSAMMLVIVVVNLFFLFSNSTALPKSIGLLCHSLITLALCGLYVHAAYASGEVLQLADRVEMRGKVRFVRIVAWASLLCVGLPVAANDVLVYFVTIDRKSDAVALYKAIRPLVEVWSLAVFAPLTIIALVTMYWLTFRALRAAGDEVRATTTIPS